MEDMKAISAILAEALKYAKEECCVDSYFLDGLDLAIEIAEAVESGKQINIEQAVKEAT